MNILALLQSRAKELSIQPQKILQHYAMERFLYRLSRSPYRERFFLKGGMLLMGMGATQGGSGSILASAHAGLTHLD